MNILIVDDEVFTVRAIQTTIHWETLGIEKTFSAYNAAKAREILMSETIDLMICDIEMPKEDGLSLVSWMRQENYPAEVIFLTCHSEFDYARRALKLQVFDYCVKPVDFEEMEKVIWKAVEKIRTQQQNELKTQMGEYWMNNRQEAAERFWQSLITAKELRSPEAIESDADKLQIDFDKDKVFRLVLISVKKIKAQLENWDNDLLIFTLQNLAKEIILEDLYSCKTFQMKDKFILIHETADDNMIEGLCRKYVDICKRYVGSSVFCYVSDGVFCEEMAPAYEQLCLVEKNDVAGEQEIVFENHLPAAQSIREILLPDELKERFNRGDREGFLRGYECFISELTKTSYLDFISLKNLQRDLLQWFLVYMDKNHIKAHEVAWLDPENDVESIEQLNRWVHTCTAGLLSEHQEAYVSNNERIVGKIKQYILEHLSEDLTREELASRVNLSPDYMSRIFKNEMHTTLSQYIIDERMEKAVLLMRTTKLNVSQIASEVGCDNFSYFSKIFKKHTGYTPRDYRMTLLC